MKKVLALFIFLILTIVLAGCKNKENQDAELKLWEENADLTAVETPEELYKKALKEDTLVIYSISSRVMDVKKSFEEAYPGLTVYVHDVRGEDLLNMLKSNYEAKTYNCDIVLCCDNTGKITNELLPKGIVYKYIPYDMKDKFYSYCNEETLTLMGEVQQVFYNSDGYEEPPIHNWWELTDEKFRGKVVVNNPLKSLAQMAQFGMIINEDEKMKDAYFDLYGKEIELKENENAGETFIRMLVENDAVFVNTNDEIVDLVGEKDQKDYVLGLMISSKIRMRDYGYEIQPINDLEPFVGTYSPNSIMITGGSKNINTAKLFIRWIYGEADGQGEGYKPYLTRGAWSARKDVQSESDIALENMNLMFLDEDYIYNNSQKLENFWLDLLTLNEK